MIIALVKENIVVNTIVADQAFVDYIRNDFQACIDITNLNPKPGIGWQYVEGSFINPQAVEAE